jgi:HSP20 family protein
MATRRDPFANFDRMRREIDELFGDLWQRSPLTQRQSSGFSPRVDVYYCGDPPKAVVKVDLSGVALDAIGLEISGRTMVISGERPVRDVEGRVYQQVEIPTGRFRRVVELTADVDAEDAKATYEDGVLRIELPLPRRDEVSRQVPIERSTGEE